MLVELRKYVFFHLSRLRPMRTSLVTALVISRLDYSLLVGGVAQWLERQSLTGELSLIYA